MKSFTYPAIFVKDEEREEYNVLFPDLEVVTDGKFVEEAFLYAKASLKAYFVYAQKYDLDFNYPTSFDEVRKMCSGNEYVLLVDAEITEKDLKK